MAKLERPPTQIEIVIGRSLAMCVHPYAAWRRYSRGGRAFVFVAYATASYAVVLSFLMLAS